jgi:hypothetical protein
MKTCCLILTIGLASVSCLGVEAADGPDAPDLFRAIDCEGAYPGHLQGVCADPGGGIYWSFTDVLVKTDSEGHILKRASVASHHGDLCFHEGRIYVAVNLGAFNRPAGQADSWVYVYDADTLEEVARQAVPEVVHGAGGMACDGKRLIVVGGLPSGVDENYVYEYDLALAFQKRHVLASGYTLMGIQTAAFADGHWWFGCYGAPKVVLQADEAFEPTGRWNFDASLGIVPLDDARFLIGSNTRKPDRGHVGHLRPALADKRDGPRFVE